MELLSLYITDYREINGQAFHLSTKYIIQYLGTPGDIEISIKINHNYIEDFFNHKSIKTVTALIGQNGAGKTSTLDYIKDNLSNGNPSLHGNSIVILEKDINDELDDNDGLKRIYYPSHWNVKLKDETDSFVMIGLSSNKEMGILNLDKIEAFEHVSIIFYSNIFDGKEETEKEGCFDISTNYLLRYDVNRYKDTSQVAAYNNSELLRQLFFLASNVPQKNLPFKLPNNLNISILTDDKIALKDKFNRYGLSAILEAYSNTSYVFDRVSEYEEQFITEIYIAAFFNFIRADFEFIGQDILRKTLKKKPSDNIKETLRRYFNNFARDKNHAYTSHAQNIIDFLDFTELLIQRQILFVGGQLPFHPLDIENNRENSEQFILKYSKAKAFTNFLNFDWPDLSSGQKSLLSLFARFYSLADEVNHDNEKLKENLIILIDEGDLYFHPEWQRKFLKILLDFLSNIFSNKKIQLVLASNSPFIASDLPKSNVIFIDKNRVVLPSINSREETFASNIHTLFSDSFFMEEALIGDFAKHKLDEIIDYLKSEDYTQELNEKYRAILNIIGEPVIKYKLEELWIEKLGREEEIKILQNRIKRLQDKTDD